MFNIKEIEATVKVVNVVASATLGQKLDLNTVIKNFPDAEFPSEKFPGVVFKLKKPKAATLLFSSGKIICTGGKSEEEARKAVKRVVQRLSRNGIIRRDKPEVKIDNLVASASLKRTLDLELVSRLDGTMYEPEQFPAVIYRMEKPKVVFLLFASGRLICAGAKTEQEIRQALKELLRKLSALKPYEIRLSRPLRTETRVAERVYQPYVSLKDFTFSEVDGKACPYVRGLWCHKKSCIGPACKFASLIKDTLADGFWGCWGFHWQQKFLGNQTKRAQRKFFD